MRIKVVLSSKGFTIPISYQSILQGVIYSLLSKDDLGNFYHDEGYHHDRKIFKCFNFSQLFGQYTIKNKVLKFDERFYFYISSQDERFLKSIYKTLLMNETLLIANKYVKIEDVELINLKPFSGIKTVTIQTLSPMLIYSTSNNYSTYYKPSDNQSHQFIIQNIKDKSKAYHYPLKELVFNIKNVIYEKERMMKYKNCFYKCYMTKMEVETNFETLLLLYNCGISSKGSCGFGMIDICYEKGHLPL